jgi:putative transposase/transposase-like zinc-binding protein
MDAPRPTVAEVFRSFQKTYLEQYPTSPEQRRVLRSVGICKTAALGGHKARCDQCGYEEFFYNSCRNRHCPQCQGLARAKWLRERTSDLLETPYFHVVFTLPDVLGPLALQNRRLVYGLLFRAASETLLRIAGDPKHLGAQIGFLAVLHTWGQTLEHHPHLHCVVPGGGLSADRSRWIPTGGSFFLPVRVLSRLFRGKFLAYLREAHDQRLLHFHGDLTKLEPVAEWTAFVRELSHREWVVYSKPPFGGPEQVLKYLARYTHRVAISNQRLVSLQDGKVIFRYKDYRAGNIERTMTLQATEFIRRFLQHVLPGSFHRIRYYGFLANSVRRANLELARRLLDPAIPERKPDAEPPDPPGEPQPGEADSSLKDSPCPACKKGRLVIIEAFPPDTAVLNAPLCSGWPDTS